MADKYPRFLMFAQTQKGRQTEGETGQAKYMTLIRNTCTKYC